MVKKYIFKMLISIINATDLGGKFYKLSAASFHRKYLVDRDTDKQIIQKRILLFLKKIKESMVLTENLIRLGSANDGGYVMYSKLWKDTSVISCGIGGNASFDFAVSGLVKSVFMFDHTIEEMQDLKPNMHFRKIGLGVVSEKSFISIPDIASNYDIKKCILKIDIEGMEWAIFDSLNLDFLKLFDQIIVEFHNLFEIASDIKGDLYLNVLDKLISGFNIINVHPNNWGEFRILCGVPFVDTLEVTFLNKEIEIIPSLDPLDLNQPNNPDELEFTLFKNSR